MPNTKYILKSGNQIKPLNDICTRGKKFQCPSRLQNNNEQLCEKEILLKGNSSQCQYVKVDISKNHIEIIPETNQFLAIFPQEEKLSIQCLQGTEIKILSGIFLIDNSPCKIIFKNHELTFQEKSFGQPIIINKPKLYFEKINLLPMKLNLKSLKLKEISSNGPIPIINENFKYHIPSAWTIILYFGVAVTIIFIIHKKMPKKKKEKSPPEPTPEEGHIRLPQEASF